MGGSLGGILYHELQCPACVFVGCRVAARFTMDAEHLAASLPELPDAPQDAPRGHDVILDWKAMPAGSDARIAGAQIALMKCAAFICVVEAA